VALIKYLHGYGNAVATQPSTISLCVWTPNVLPSTKKIVAVTKGGGGRVQRMTQRDVFNCRFLHFGSLLSIYPTETLEHVYESVLVSDYLSKLWLYMTVVSNKPVYTTFVHLCMFPYISLALMNWTDYITKGRINLPTQETVTRKYETTIKNQPQDLFNFHCLELISI
jgi:hypothetical protein